MSFSIDNKPAHEPNILSFKLYKGCRAIIIILCTFLDISAYFYHLVWLRYAIIISSNSVKPNQIKTFIGH